VHLSAGRSTKIFGAMFIFYLNFRCKLNSMGKYFKMFWTKCNFGGQVCKISYENFMIIFKMGVVWLQKLTLKVSLHSHAKGKNKQNIIRKELLSRIN
jgi:hypothetical protein